MGYFIGVLIGGTVGFFIGTFFSANKIDELNNIITKLKVKIYKLENKE